MTYRGLGGAGAFPSGGARKGGVAERERAAGRAGVRRRGGPPAGDNLRPRGRSGRGLPTRPAPTCAVRQLILMDWLTKGRPAAKKARRYRQCNGWPRDPRRLRAGGKAAKGTALPAFRPTWADRGERAQAPRARGRGFRDAASVPHPQQRAMGRNSESRGHRTGYRRIPNYPHLCVCEAIPEPGGHRTGYRRVQGSLGVAGGDMRAAPGEARPGKL